jgi:uncharacterized protein (DUF1499 family)
MPKSCADRGANLHSTDDSPKGWDMTPIEFREKKTREIQELLEKISSLDGASCSSENKDRLSAPTRKADRCCVQSVIGTTLLWLKAEK